MRQWLVFTLVLWVVTGVSPSRGQSVQETIDLASLATALDDFKKVLDERWSYRHATSADFDSAIAQVRQRSATGMSINQFGLELHKIVALGIDGHSSVIGYRIPGKTYLPFLIEPSGDHFVAFNSDRSGFLAKDFPLIISIDGRHLSDWLKAASVIVPKGSPQYVRHRSLGRLRNIEFIRGQMGLPQNETVDVVVQSAAGDRQQTLTLRLTNASPTAGVWPRHRSQLLDAKIGYLRMPYMTTESSVQEIKNWMPKFRNAVGLIIDVRDNDGGSRDALPLIYSYLASAKDPPRVFTAAAYRLHPENKEDHLAKGHFMYRSNSPGWTEAQKREISTFAKNFKPRWDYPKEDFSELHYLALQHQANPDIFQYDKPVIVLMNAKCFSATDIFLAGLKGMRNVTLMGSASSGGSAASQEFPLGSTSLRVRVGSMISFQEDGQLFDGVGVKPDVLIEPFPEYFIGGHDNVLEEAKRRLTQAGPAQ